jgi:membrane dipeptidase
MRKLIIAGLITVLLVGLILFFVLPGKLGQSMNGVVGPQEISVSDEARRLHSSLLIIDLHADSLLWDRDLLERGSWGHVDVPRLIEGNVAIQAFTIVTKTPRSMNIEHNDASTDNISLLAVLERWPLSAWTSLAERTLHQARRLQKAAEASHGRLILLRSSADVEKYLKNREARAGVVAGFLGIEGAHALEGKIENLDRFYDAGVRMIGLTHFFDNEAGGSAHGIEKGGLTDFGRELVKRMEARRILVDLAHASPNVIQEVTRTATRPVVVSHSGVKGTCNNSRNLGDDQLRAIAATGGVIGIGYWEAAVCGTDAKAIARAVRHAITVAGADNVGLGSDFDGAVETPFDTAALVRLTDALLKEGLSEADIRKVMGENAARLLSAGL